MLSTWYIHRIDPVSQATPTDRKDFCLYKRFQMSHWRKLSIRHNWHLAFDIMEILIYCIYVGSPLSARFVLIGGRWDKPINKHIFFTWTKHMKLSYVFVKLVWSCMLQAVCCMLWGGARHSCSQSFLNSNKNVQALPCRALLVGILDWKIF